jgi:hypothetical protein
MTIALAFVASLWMAIAQPLDPIQYTALMDVYDGLGSFHLAHTTTLSAIFPGCNGTICPRFASSLNCTAPMIELLCSDGNVKNLYVCILSIGNGVTVDFH